MQKETTRVLLDPVARFALELMALSTSISCQLTTTLLASSW